MRSNIALAADAYFAALLSEQTELMLKRESMGLAGELLLGALTMALGFGIEVAAVEIATRVLAKAAWEQQVAASAIHDLAAKAAKTIKTAANPLVSAAKDSIKARFTGMDPDKAEKANFLEQLKRTGTVYWKTVLDACILGTDVELLTGVEATKPDVLNYESMRRSVDSLYERFKSQHFEQVQALPGGARKIVRLTSNKRSRLALVEMRDAHTIHASGHGESDYHMPAVHMFIRWIDPEFEDNATSIQEDRIGAVETIDVGGDPTEYPFADQTLEVEEWAHRAKVGTLK